MWIMECWICIYVYVKIYINIYIYIYSINIVHNDVARNVDYGVLDMYIYICIYIHK